MRKKLTQLICIGALSTNINASVFGGLEIGSGSISPLDGVDSSGVIYLGGFLKKYIDDPLSSSYVWDLNLRYYGDSNDSKKQANKATYNMSQFSISYLGGYGFYNETFGMRINSLLGFGFDSAHVEMKEGYKITKDDNLSTAFAKAGVVTFPFMSKNTSVYLQAFYKYYITSKNKLLEFNTDKKQGVIEGEIGVYYDKISLKCGIMDSLLSKKQINPYCIFGYGFNFKI